MNNITNNIKKNFTIIPNELIDEKTISDRARFLFVFMCSKPDDWKFRNFHLCKNLGYTEETLRKYMKILIDRGWITKEKQKRIGGKFTSNLYTLNAKPIKIIPTRKNTVTEKNRVGKNKTHSNTKYNKTKKAKKFNFNTPKEKNSRVKPLI